MHKRISRWVLKNEVLILIICAALLIRIPSWFEPYWYGDEAIYLTIGQSLNRGVDLYSEIHDNKPPLVYLAAAVANGDQFWFKFLVTVWNLATVVCFHKLAEKVTAKKWLINLGTSGFAFVTAWPKLEGNIANAELFFLLPTAIAAIILWKKDTNLKTVFWGGFALGIAGLFKMPAIIEAGIWPLYWLVFGDRYWWKKTAVLAAGVLLPIVGSMGYYQILGTGREYFTAAWAQNIPYLSSWKSTSDDVGIYSLKGRMAVLVIILAVIYGLSRKWGKNAMLVSSWLMFTLFAALLSGRPYPHYLLQATIPAVLAAILLVTEKQTVKILSTFMAVVVFMAVSIFHFYNYPVRGYYQNFWDWAVGNKTRVEYISWFGPEVVRNYQVVALVKSLTVKNEPIFVWGDQPMIYAASRRAVTGKYTVKYHIKDFKAEDKTLAELNSARPKVIVSYGSEEELPGFSEWLGENYSIEKIVGGIKIFVLAR